MIDPGINAQIQDLDNRMKTHKHDGTSSSKMNDGIVTVPMSFETGEQTTTKIYFPFGVRIKKIRGIVMKALANTDAGTITGANIQGNSTSGQLSFALSSALNTEASVLPLDNNVVSKDGYYKLTAAKTTVGGKVLVTLEYERVMV